MVRLVTFRDLDPWYKPDETGFNKVGYVTADDNVIFPLMRGMTQKPLRKITSRKHELLAFSIDSTRESENVEAFFTKNKLNSNLFFRGVKELHSGDLSFFQRPIRLPLLEPLPPHEYEERWQQFIAKLVPGDLLFAYNTKNLISRVIKLVDNGTWSHVALCTGHGLVCESGKAGVLERGVEAYHSPSYRLGIYRPNNMPPETREKIIAIARTQIGGSYNYFGVLRLGAMKLLGITRKNNAPRNLSPNDIARESDKLALICVL